MKLSRPILTILIFVTISCSRNSENQSSPLSESEKDLVINDGYGDYLDSIGGAREFFCKFAILDDSLAMQQLLYNLEGKSEQELVFTSEDIIYGAYFEDSVDKDNFTDFQLFDHTYADSIAKTWLTSDQSEIIPYAITRPYQPDTCDLVVIQEYPIPSAPGCFPTRYYALIFQKVNGKWKLIDRI